MPTKKSVPLAIFPPLFSQYVSTFFPNMESFVMSIQKSQFGYYPSALTFLVTFRSCQIKAPSQAFSWNCNSQGLRNMIKSNIYGIIYLLLLLSAYLYKWIINESKFMSTGVEKNPVYNFICILVHLAGKQTPGIMSQKHEDPNTITKLSRLSKSKPHLFFFQIPVDFLQGFLNKGTFMISHELLLTYWINGKNNRSLKLAIHYAIGQFLIP